MSTAGAKTTTDVSRDVSFPDLPTAELDSGGWKRVEESVETVYKIPTLRVVAATVRYEDDRTRSALCRATDGIVDQPIRFFAATTLSFHPSLPFGVSKAMVAPLVKREARETFTDRLREAEITDIDQTESEQLTFADGKTLTLTGYHGHIALTPDVSVPLACWVAVWSVSSGFRIVSGGYPRESLASVFDIEDEQLERSGQAYYLEFLSLLRGVA